MQDTFTLLKERLSILDVMGTYGIYPNRHNQVLCPFHNEKTPSMKVYPATESFYCFGCGASGSVIDFVRLMEKVDPLEAAKRLDAMYSLHLFAERPDSDEIRRKAQQAQAERDRLNAFDEWTQKACNTIAEYLHLLNAWERDYAPKTPEEEWDERFCEALRNLDKWDCLYMSVFVEGDFKVKTQFYQNYREAVKTIEKRLHEVRKNGTA